MVPGPIALVIGGSSGLGAATALALARRHAQVIVHGRDCLKTRAVATRCNGTALLGDLGTATGCRDVVTAATAMHGGIDLLICAAGMGWSGSFDSMPTERIEELIAINLSAPMQLARDVLPGMLTRGHGQIVFVSSIAGRASVAGEAVYAASKAGLDGFADSLRLEAAGTPIRIQTLVPAVIDTPFFEQRGVPYTRRTPRPQTAEQVAEQLVSLMNSDRPEAWTNRSLRAAAILRAGAPGTYTRLAARWGSPTRFGHH